MEPKYIWTEEETWYSGCNFAETEDELVRNYAVAQIQNAYNGPVCMVPIFSTFKQEVCPLELNSIDEKAHELLSNLMDDLEGYRHGDDVAEVTEEMTKLSQAFVKKIATLMGASTYKMVESSSVDMRVWMLNNFPDQEVEFDEE